MQDSSSAWVETDPQLMCFSPGQLDLWVEAFSYCDLIDTNKAALENNQSFKINRHATLTRHIVNPILWHLNLKNKIKILKIIAALQQL